MSIITWNPNDKSNGVTLSNNNLTATIQNHENAYLRATEGKSSGKWYWEVKIDNIEGVHALYVGVANKNAFGSNSDNSNIRTYYQLTGNKFPENEPYGKIYNNINDVVSVLLDLDNGTLEFYLNGVSQGISHTDVLSLGIPVFPYLSTGAVSTKSSVISTTNFGATKFDIVDSNPKLWNQLVKDGYKPYDINNVDWLYNVLIKSNNRILTFQNNEWVDTELNEPLTKEDFYNYNIGTLRLIPEEKILELGNSFEILAYTECDITPKIVLPIPPTKPYRLLDNPSIVTYTEDDEIPILSQTVTASTKVRFLVSKDKTNYQVYRNSEWITIDKDNILEQGMTILELESIPQEVWAEWFENEAHKHSFDILIGMYSESPNPIIRSITVNYAENESPIIINAYIEPDTIHNEFAWVKAYVKDYEGDKISFKVLIKRAGQKEFVQVSPLEGWYDRSTSETEITQAFNFPYFNPGENEVKLVVKDERGAEGEWTGRIILSNTNPTITIAYDDFSMRATIGDDDNDMISYRIAINGELVFDYTDFVPSKTLVNYVFDTSKMKFGEENIITIEVKDTHGGYAKQEFAVIGSYRGLMFKNENGEYFVNSNGEVLMDLLFDKTLIAGQISETKKVILENRHEFPITNVQIKPDNPNFVKGAVLEISETEMPFTPKDIIKVLEVMPSLGEKDFYVRVKTTREAHQGGYFYIKSTATPV